MYKYTIDGGEVEVPGKYEVCSRCEGVGRHTNPSIDGNGITSEEWNGPDWDDESREAYMSGGYDVLCETCQGERVVLQPDFALIPSEQQEEIYQQEREEAEYRAMVAAERRAGC